MPGCMKYPKPQRRKRKKHKASILQSKDGTCYLCMKLNRDYRIHAALHKHHIFGGPNRSISEAEGFTVYLCPAHHEFGPAAVHNNSEHMRILQRDAQAAFEETGTRQQFMALIGRNFLEPDARADERTEK